MPEILSKYQINTLLDNNIEGGRIDGGAECNVYCLTPDDRKVIALHISKETVVPVKQTYYTHKLFSTLFPYNFPEFYTSFSDSNDTLMPSGTIRKRIWESDTSRIRYPFNCVRNVVIKLDLPFYFDCFHTNFYVSSDGGEYYLDTIGYINPLVLDKSGILNYMENNPKSDGEKYSRIEIKTVNFCIERLNELERMTAGTQYSN